MAKTKISEFSTTAGNNTDINSINIAEGCAPSGINDAIRELMRQLKEFQTGGAGDSVNSGGDFSVATNKFTVASASGNTAVAGTLAVTGTTTLTGALVANGNATLGDGSGDTVTVKGTPTLEVNPTLSGGTANGVLYLNGSKVATSGSALTFDGTNLGVSGAIGVGGTSTTGNQASTGTAGTFSITGVGGAVYLQTGQNTSAGSYAPLVFTNMGASTEYMRLTSTGLGIGTSSPGAKLEVSGSTQATGAVLRLTNSAESSSWAAGDVVGEIDFYSADSSNPAIKSKIVSVTQSGGNYPTDVALTFSTYNGTLSERMRLDSSGNLGLGVTPSAWGSSNRALQVATTGAIWSPGGADIRLSNNQYRDSANSRVYIANGPAQEYAQDSSGNHIWQIAPSGTAGNAITFTQAMTLNASGYLSIGTTDAFGKLTIKETTTNFEVNTDSSGGSILTYDRGAGAYKQLNLRGSQFLFSVNDVEKARIDSSGNLLVGTTSTDPRNFTSGTGYKLGDSFEFANSSTVNVINRTSSGSGTFVGFRVQASGVGSISTDGTSTSYNTSSDYRLKDNHQPLTGSGAFIDALQPKTWEWKADGSKGVGFIAHEVQAVSPGSVVGEKDAVDEDGKPKYQAMEYGSAEFIANIIAELQSLRARVAQLESN